MSLVLLCCQSTTSTQIQSITLPSQAERWQPLFRQNVCCAPHRNLNTHTQLSAAHTNHICSHTFEQTCAQTQKCTHKVPQQLLAAASCMPSSSSLFRSFLHTLPALHGFDTDKCYLRHLRRLKKHSRTFSIFTPPNLCCCFFWLLPSIHAYENRAR